MAVIPEQNTMKKARRFARSDPPPSSGRRARFHLRGLWILLLISFRILLLRGSCLPPPKSSPGGCAFRRAAPPWRTFGASWPKKWRSKRPSKNVQILMPFQHRFWSVLAPFWRLKMVPKLSKNRSKSGFRAFLFPHRLLH